MNALLEMLLDILQLETTSRVAKKAADSLKEDERNASPEPEKKSKAKKPNQPLQRNASTGSVSNFESPARRG
jgi:hypothetical protein